MRKSVFFAILLMVMSAASDKYFPCLSAADSGNFSEVRTGLLKKFIGLDLEMLVNRDEAYLNSVGANFDVDNNSYFIDDSTHPKKKGDGFLILLAYKRKNEVEITIFPPLDASNRFLRSRIRAADRSLIRRIAYLPGEEADDYISLPQLSAPEVLLTLR